MDSKYLKPPYTAVHKKANTALQVIRLIKSYFNKNNAYIKINNPQLWNLACTFNAPPTQSQTKCWISKCIKTVLKKLKHIYFVQKPFCMQQPSSTCTNDAVQTLLLHKLYNLQMTKSECLILNFESSHQKKYFQGKAKLLQPLGRVPAVGLLNRWGGTQTLFNFNSLVPLISSVI
jgi:hypothetical protein